METNSILSPQINAAQIDVATNRRMLELYELRLKYMSYNSTTKTEAEQVEVDILQIKTIACIDKLKTIIAEKEAMFREEFLQYIDDFEQINLGNKI
jgi:hypothetical protein